jgi:hypothetical protein
MDFVQAGKIIGPAIALIVGMYNGGMWVNSHFAKTTDIQDIKASNRFRDLRFEEKVMTDRGTAIQLRLWRIEKLYPKGVSTAPVAVQELYRQMVVDQAEVRRQVQNIMETYRTVGYPATDDYYRYEQPIR